MIRVFSQNLCSWGAGENAIAERTGRVTKLVELYAPDIFAVQEATPAWRDYLYANMPGYDHIGLPRQEGPKGESCDIFWNTDRYALLSGGTRWLSDTPNVISKLEDSKHYRVFTWAVLKKKDEEKQFLVCNVHTDFITQEVCLEQLKRMVEFAREFRLPTVFLGDMNMERHHTGYTWMCSQLEDVYLEAHVKEYAEIKTSHDFGIKAKDCDYIFVNDGFCSCKYRVAAEKIDGKFVSDHYGVMAEVDFR